MTDLSPKTPKVQPIPGVGMVCFRGEEVVLVNRAKPPRLGEWSIPGGRIEPGETARAGALRELREETGLTAEIISLVDTVDAIFKDPSGHISHHYVLIDFVATWRSGEPVAGDDAADAKFVPISKAIELVAWDETRRILRQSVEIAQKHIQA